MKVSQIIADVRSELIEASASFWSDAELLALANRAERDFVQKTRCLEGKAFLSTVAGQQDYTLPGNWLSALAVFVNTSTTTIPSWVRIYPTNLEKETQLNANFNSSDSNLRANPLRYWIWNKSIYFDPIPSTNGSGNVLMFFKSKPTTLAMTDDTNIDDSLSEAINNFMLWKAFKKEKEQDEATEYMTLYEMNVKQGFRWVKLQAGDERRRFDIESPRGFDAGPAGFNPFGN